MDIVSSLSIFRSYCCFRSFFPHAIFGDDQFRRAETGLHQQSSTTRNLDEMINDRHFVPLSSPFLA